MDDAVATPTRRRRAAAKIVAADPDDVVVPVGEDGEAVSSVPHPELDPLIGMYNGLKTMTAL